MTLKNFASRFGKKSTPSETNADVEASRAETEPPKTPFSLEGEADTGADSELDGDQPDPQGDAHDDQGRSFTIAESSFTVYDPGSQRQIPFSGEAITAEGAELQVPESIRELIIASSAGEIYYSRSHQTNPHILSEIKKIEKTLGNTRHKMAIDMTTISELYRKAAKLRGSSPQGGRKIEQSTMQRALVTLVANAANRNASDIHIIVNQDRAVTKFRIDGIMNEISEMQPQYAHELLASAFNMADASDATYQQRQYQGARISSLSTELPTGVQSLRLQFNPLANEGRYLIIRILYSGSGEQLDLERLGYSEEQVRQLNTMSARPVGINIVSGPTGSGKSTTLKAVLEGVIQRRGGEVNTITIEDPPEYVIHAAQQMPVVNAKTQEEREEAFTQAIAAGLRSDPNIMMIGEIRDLASANLAVEGALSGHPIYASLHANTAMDILTRLRDMGVDDFKVYDNTVFSGLVGQRLVRKLCPSCRVKFDDVVAQDEAFPDDEKVIAPLLRERVQTMKDFTPASVFENHDLYVAGSGCEHCSGGYRGRAVVAEIILPDDHFMDLMQANRKSEARAYWFEKMNGIDLLGSSWMRAIEGTVSPIDIENEVALMSPLEAHKIAFEYWADKLGLST